MPWNSSREGAIANSPIPSERSLASQAVMTIPNLLAFIRFMIIPWVLYLIWQNQAEADHMAVYLIIMASLLDFIDGKLARGFNWVSQVGKMLDPVIDKVGLNSTFIILIIREFYYNENTSGLLIFSVFLIFLRDLFIVFAGILFYRIKEEILVSNNLGRATVFFLIITLMLYLLRLPGELSRWGIKASLVFVDVLVIASGLVYIQRLFQKLTR